MSEGYSSVQDVMVTPVTTVGIQLMIQTAAGSLSLAGLPANADAFTITVSGTVYTYTFKTAIAGAGDVLIGATAAACIFNLWSAIFGKAGSGSLYFAGTVPVPQGPSSVVLSIQPSIFANGYVNGATTLPLQSGVGYNFALAASVNTSTNLSVSGANMTTAAGKPRNGVLHIVVLRPGAANATAQIYDSAQVTGAPAGPTKVFMDAQSGWSNSLEYGNMAFTNGLYAVVTSAGSLASLQATYE